MARARNTSTATAAWAEAPASKVGETSATVVEVIAGLIRDRAGRILLGQRPPGKYLAGSWEFPGGKRAPGESPQQALIRELQEELGIDVSDAALRPWLSLRHRYPELTIRLRLYEVEAFQGQPRGLEGQAVAWFEPEALQQLTMPAADRPIVAVLGLDARMAITPDPQLLGGTEALLDWTRRGLAAGLRLFQLRTSSLDSEHLEALGQAFGELVRARGGRWLLNGPAELAQALGADGLHMDSAGLHAASVRPLDECFLVSASCHEAADLEKAGDLGLDFVTLSPVLATRSHPEAQALDWAQFQRLCEVSPLPVYALGGLSPALLEQVRDHGGFGVAGIRGFVDLQGN